VLSTPTSTCVSWCWWHVGRAHHRIGAVPTLLSDSLGCFLGHRLLVGIPPLRDTLRDEGRGTRCAAYRGRNALGKGGLVDSSKSRCDIRGSRIRFQSIPVNVQLTSQITCPHCGHSETETMPTDACVGFYPCKGCGTMLRPKQGDCCVFCTYGTVPCPPIQEGDGCCE
jgi:hypothetical protein